MDERLTRLARLCDEGKSYSLYFDTLNNNGLLKEPVQKTIDKEIWEEVLRLAAEYSEEDDDDQT